jgi:DNA helicase-2/ATP-dependent DNA helicase PcrA
MDYLETLNNQQKEAVLYTKGPLLIVAGAGAGKTKTITSRIIHLIHEGINPESILAITFTNKAAKEMRDRVFKMIEEKEHGFDLSYKEEKIPFISTFHSLGVFIIKENAHLIGLNKYFSILDESDAISNIKSIMKDLDIDPKENEPKKIKSIISRSKGDFVTVESFSQNSNGHFQDMVARIWREYEARNKKEKSLDFDDLLLEAVLILKKYPEIKHGYQNRWQYIHIDEYQDTNEVQYELTKLLVGKDENICVVGDTDQNIYSWRGANIKNMLHFEKDFPSAKIVMLEQNYRSTKTIIEAANCVIEKNQYRVPKKLFTENEEGESIAICEAFDEQAESMYVTNKIDELLEKIDPEEIAVLYRANFQSRVLEEAFLQKQIPYQVLGTKFFDRKEIKDVLAYLRAAYNQENLSDIKRIINFPARGLGKVTIAKLFSGQKNELPKKTQDKIDLFYKTLTDIFEFAEKNKPSDIIKFIIEKTEIKTELESGSSDDLERLENIMELVTLALKYDNQGNGVEKLLEDAALSSDQDTLLQKSRGVRLMTVHASKGLEFKYVFITGLEQDLFPHSKDGSRVKEDKEEERRLFYVAITRAREKLFLTYASLRTIFGMKQVNSPSEFIYDIPPQLTSFEQAHNNGGDKIVYL